MNGTPTGALPDIYAVCVSCKHLSTCGKSPKDCGEIAAGEITDAAEQKERNTAARLVYAEEIAEDVGKLEAERDELKARVAELEAFKSTLFGLITAQDNLIRMYTK